MRADRGARWLGPWLAALLFAGCAGRLVSPVPLPPHRATVDADYDRTWRAFVRVLALDGVPLRAVDRDSGVLATDEFLSPIGLYVDCGRIGSDTIEGEATASYTVYVEGRPGGGTLVQIVGRMRSHATRKGSSGSLEPVPVYQCASTGRFEASLVDSVRALVRP